MFQSFHGVTVTYGEKNGFLSLLISSIFPKQIESFLVISCKTCRARNHTFSYWTNIIVHVPASCDVAPLIYIHIDLGTLPGPWASRCLAVRADQRAPPCCVPEHGLCCPPCWVSAANLSGVCAPAAMRPMTSRNCKSKNQKHIRVIRSLQTAVNTPWTAVPWPRRRTCSGRLWMEHFTMQEFRSFLI